MTRWRISPDHPWQDGEPSSFQRTIPTFEREQAAEVPDHLPCISCGQPSDDHPVCPGCWQTEIPVQVFTSIEEWLLNEQDVLRSEAQRRHAWAKRDDHVTGSYINLLLRNARDLGPGPAIRTVEARRRKPVALDEDRWRTGGGDG